MKITEQKLREIIKEELISLKEGVKGYDIGPKLDDFDGMDFYNAQYEISDDDGFTDAVDEDGWKSIFKIAKKYKSKLKKHGIKSEKDLENFAKWLSGGEHMKSESVVNEGFSTWEIEFGKGIVSGVDYSKAGKVSVKARNTVEAIKKAVKEVGNAGDWMVVDVKSLTKI